MPDKEKNTEYAKNHREKKWSQGLVRKCVWIHESNVETLKEAVEFMEYPNIKLERGEFK